MPQSLVPLPPRQLRRPALPVPFSPATAVPPLQLLALPSPGPTSGGRDLRTAKDRVLPARRAPAIRVQPSALTLALEVARNAALRHHLRQQAVPRGTLLLFQIAAGTHDILEHAVGVTGKDPHFLTAAAIFYTEEVLWCRDADAYRVLGLNPVAPLEAVKKHFDTLLDWLANSHDQHHRSHDLGRISFAWQSISGTPGGDRRPHWTAK